MEFRSSVRPSPITGTWYTSDKQILAAEMDTFLDEAKISDDEIQGEVVGLISPHAGHRYSGRTAGYAYRTVKGQERDLVVILSPSHQYSPGELITTAFHAYETPLGNVEVDVDLLSKLAEKLKNKGIPIHQISNDPEHALEIQLPFLQRALKGNFKLLPLMVRTRDPIILQTIASEVFEAIKDKSFLLVASTDLSHFFPLDIAEKMDAEMLRVIKDMDPEGVLFAEQDGIAAACVASSVAAVLWMALKAGAGKTYILNYSTSADATGDRTSVVGYGAAAIVR